MTQHWVCPNCKLATTTRGPFLPNRFHTCPRLRGITAPMVIAGTKAKVEAHVREDYVGDEIVTHDDDGRPVMSVTTEREDGTDVAVFAPLAVTSAISPER